MLQPTGLAVLSQLGLAAEAIGRGQRIDQLRGEADGRVVLDVHYAALKGHERFGIGIHRSSLFQTLYDALTLTTAAIVTGRQVIEADGSSLAFTEGKPEGPFDVIVDALGTRSTLADPDVRELRYGALWTTVDLLPCGFEQNVLSQRYQRANVMAGVLPLGSGKAALFWSLRAQDYSDWLRCGLDAWKQHVLALWPATGPMLEQLATPQQLTFARYAHKTLRRPVSGRLIHIGDSWHSASPQLGQGANMAMLDAWALAKALREQEDLETGLARFARMRRKHVHLYQSLTALLTPVYQSDSKSIPFVRDRIMGPLSKIWPLTTFQAALVSGLVGSPLRPLGIDFAPVRTDR